MFLRFCCAGLNFIATWIYLSVRWPLVGIAFGWIPAALAAAFGFFAMDVVLDLLT